MFGVPQGFITGPHFFNVYTCDIFLQINTSEFFSYAYDNTLLASAQNHFSIFPSSLKNADITPVFKKGDRNLKDNYRPVSILSSISKIFVPCMFQQISKFMEPLLSQYQCGF